MPGKQVAIAIKCLREVGKQAQQAIQNYYSARRVNDPQYVNMHAGMQASCGIKEGLYAA